MADIAEAATSTGRAERNFERAALYGPLRHRMSMRRAAANVRRARSDMRRILINILEEESENDPVQPKHDHLCGILWNGILERVFPRLALWRHGCPHEWYGE
jgi:hypothetical protein